MKLQFALLIITVLVGFSFIGLVIYNGSGIKERAKKEVLLNTGKMMESLASDSSGSKLTASLLDVYPADIGNKTKSPTPMADVYLCKLGNEQDTLRTDTIIILDTRLRENGKSLSNPTIYEVDAKPVKGPLICRVMLPQNMIVKFKTYRYKYANVELMSEF